jgi:hypothetical protein
MILLQRVVLYHSRQSNSYTFAKNIGGGKGRITLAEDTLRTWARGKDANSMLGCTFLTRNQRFIAENCKR